MAIVTIETIDLILRNTECFPSLTIEIISNDDKWRSSWLESIDGKYHFIINKLTNDQALLRIFGYIGGLECWYEGKIRESNTICKFKNRSLEIEINVIFRSEVDKNGWFYLDDNGKEQGPFESWRLFKWTTEGYFDESSLIRRSNDKNYTNLGNVFLEIENEANQQVKTKMYTQARQSLEKATEYLQHYKSNRWRTNTGRLVSILDKKKLSDESQNIN